MAWYSSAKAYRYPIAVDGSGHGGGAVDVLISIPSSWDLFWDNVESDHFDVVVTLSDGTLTTFDFVSWTYATKTATIECDNVVVGAGETLFLWIYWGESGASDESSAFVGAAHLTGTVTFMAPTERVFAVKRESPGVTTPTQELAKTTNEELYVWWDVTNIVARAVGALNGSNHFESVDAVTALDVELAGAAQAAMTVDASTRIVQTADGSVYVLTFHTGGSDATDYTIRAVFNFATVQADDQSVEGRILLKVNDPDET